MRHFFIARPVTALSSGMAASTRMTTLIAPSGTLHRAAAGLSRTISSAIDLAAVAAATDHNLQPTPCAKEQPR
jgi:hypothetical protein